MGVRVELEWKARQPDRDCSVLREPLHSLRSPAFFLSMSLNVAGSLDGSVNPRTLHGLTESKYQLLSPTELLRASSKSQHELCELKCKCETKMRADLK